MRDVLTLNGSTVTVGSSDVASILGVSPWSGPWQTWCRLVGLVPRYDGATTGPQARGNMLEPSLGQRWCDENAAEMISRGFIMHRGPAIGTPPYIGPHPWMSCRMDFGLYKYGGNTLFKVVEAKSTRFFGDDWNDGPIQYVAQVNWQFACLSPPDGGHIAAYATVTDEYRDYRVERNERLERRLIARVWDFYSEYVLTGTPPPIDGTDGCAAGLGAMYKQKSDAFRDATDTDRALARDLHRVRAEIEALETKQTLLENTLKSSVGEYAGIDGILTWKEQKGRLRLNLPNEVAQTYVPDHVLAKYAERGAPHRVLRLKNEKD